jgi:hypothetical protein
MNNLLNRFETNVNDAKKSQPELSKVLDDIYATVIAKFNAQSAAYQCATELRDAQDAGGGRENDIYNAIYNAFPKEVREGYTLEVLLTPNGVNPPDVKAIVREVVDDFQTRGLIDAATAKALTRFRL